MKNQKHSIAKQLVIIGLILAIISMSVPKQTQAVYPVFDAANTSVNKITSIQSILQVVHDTYMKLKETVLDPLAWALAKQLLQSVTADVIDWINSGFNGSPAFLTHPQSFFLDSANQLTGAFIANNGILQDLCSPFNLNLRLDIALRAQESLPARQQRYACTLDTIIENVRNARASAGVSVNGSTVAGVQAGSGGIDAFMGGDFSQGGWPAFIAMTTEQQNNWIGAKLLADADLQNEIEKAQTAINNDLNRGGGFMSYKVCENIDPENSEDYSALNNPEITPKMGSDGNVTYQICHTETPGSVISSALNVQLSSGNDSLVAADEIDEIISAAFNQLVKNILQKGLYSSSQGEYNYGETQSLIDNLRTDTANTKPADNTKTELLDNIEGNITIANRYKALRDKTLADINNMKALYESLCPSSQRDNILAGQIGPLQAQYQNKADQANNSLNTLNGIKTEASRTNDPKLIDQLSKRYGNMLSSGTIITENDITNANNDQESVNSTLEMLQTQYGQLLSACTTTI
jgi:hypothetical protein